MPLAAGTRLGSYEIVSPIGKGGMGEVYRARDTKLERDVAIKVLPEEFANDEERLARFEREAKLLASLNHPNIASIYGFESGALVLELVDGPTLAARIAQGAIPVDEAIAIAKQIADALEAGHEAGVIHRDLKPANIKLKEDGTVKVLDYGLAKAFEGDSPSGADSDLSQSPTLTRQGTQVGVILGTAAYMSPEQAKGKRVDKRTDIWAFGVVMYEMLTGDNAFPGDDISEVLASVIKLEPHWAALPEDVSAGVRLLLRRCLEKDPRWRIRDIGDARLRITDAVVGDAPPPLAKRRTTIPLVLGAMMLLAAVALTVSWMKPSPVARTPLRFELSPGAELRPFGSSAIAVSPDGRRLAYLTNAADAPSGSQDIAFGQRGRILLRELNELESRPLPDTESAQEFFFSPDGQWLAFFSNGELKKIHVTGRAASTVCDAPDAYGGSWGSDDTIVFARDRVGLLRVSAGGGTPEALTTLKDGEQSHRWPRILPTGDVVFSILEMDSQLNVSVVSAETGDRKVLVDDATDGRYMMSGHLAFIQERTLYAAPFALDRLELTGLPKPVVEDVRMASLVAESAAHLDVSNTGLLVYLHGDLRVYEIVSANRQGELSLILDERARFTQPRFSPDGRRLAFLKPFENPTESDVWVHDLERRTTTRLTLDPGYDITPTWSPDGDYVAFASPRDGARFNLYRKRSDGSGEPERLTESATGQYLGDWSPGGRLLAFTEEDEDGGPNNVSVLDLETQVVTRVLDAAFGESDPSFSSDGRFLAYMADESGRYEVYVRPYPELGAKVQVSIDGGLYPVFGPDGRSLFYQAALHGGDFRFMRGGGDIRFMVVDYATDGGRFVAGEPRELVRGPFAVGPRPQYDVAPDGERLVLLRRRDTSAPTITVFVNWFSELERLVPTK